MGKIWRMILEFPLRSGRGSRLQRQMNKERTWKKKGQRSPSSNQARRQSVMTYRGRFSISCHWISPIEETTPKVTTKILKLRHLDCLYSRTSSLVEKDEISCFEENFSLLKIACWEQITQPPIVEDLDSLFGGIWAIYFGFSKGENLEIYSTKPSHMSDSLYTQYNIIYICNNASFEVCL